MHCAIFFKYTPYNIVIHIQDVLENYVKFKGWVVVMVSCNVFCLVRHDCYWRINAYLNEESNHWMESNSSHLRWLLLSLQNTHTHTHTRSHTYSNLKKMLGFVMLSEDRYVCFHILNFNQFNLIWYIQYCTSSYGRSVILHTQILELFPPSFLQIHDATILNMITTTTATNQKKGRCPVSVAFSMTNAFLTQTFKYLTNVVGWLYKQHTNNY